LGAVVTCDGQLDEPARGRFACSLRHGCAVAQMIESLGATSDYTGDIAEHILDTVAQQVRDAHRTGPGDPRRASGTAPGDRPGALR
jgi:hypothetical protein